MGIRLQGRLDSAYAGMHGATGRDVLLIEEDPVLASGMTETIESMGHRVLGVARNRGEAEAAAGTARLDAVVADFHYPPEDRSDAAIDGLLGGIDTPIVLVMAGIDDAEDQRGAPAYAIATPFQPAELKVLLTQALQNRGNDDCVMLAVSAGNTAADHGEYPDIDMKFTPEGYAHKDGTPYAGTKRAS